METPNQPAGMVPLPLFKPQPEVKKEKVNVWLKSIGSLALYLALGYFFFSQRWTFLLVITGVIIFHELGHFVAMKIFRYRELGIFFIPLLGAYVSGTKQEVSQRQSAIILLAGPVPGILLGAAIYIFLDPAPFSYLDMTGKLLIFLNLLNLIPVYPLDGGQLLHRLFLDNFQLIGRIFVVISAILLAYVAIDLRFYPLLLFPFLLLGRLVSEIQQERVVNRIEAEGIDLLKSYEELTPEEYWRIRNAVIKHMPQFADVPPAPPYEESPKEEQIIQAIQNLLQRSLEQDLSLAGKFFIILLWVACFYLPFQLNLSLGWL